MCRDGYRAECPAPGCTGVMTCRDADGCSEHDWSLFYEDNEEQDTPAPSPSAAQEAPDGANWAEGEPPQQEFIGPAHPNYQGPKAGHDEGRVCRCVSVHRPAPLELERHHVWPLGMGGPEEDWNVEWVCPTAHMNAHELLRAMMRQDRAVPLEEFSREYVQPVSRWAHHLAVVGYLRWKNHVNGGPAQAARLRVEFSGEGEG